FDVTTIDWHAEVGELVMLKLPNFSVLRRLGRGSYGEVYLIRKQVTDSHKDAYSQGSDQLIAVKCIPRQKLSKRGEDNLISEISILQKLSHPHIVRMLDFSWDTRNVFLFMEYCAGGDLSDFLHAKSRLPEPLVRRFLRQMALALQYLKEKNIIHMDLKPQNILLTSSTNPVLKVTDFGFAKRTKDTIQLNELRGTLLYMAPEVYCEGIYHPSCDLWSVGIILFECLFGNPPYASEDSKQLKAKLLTAKPIVIPSDVRISANCAALLRGLLKRNPEERMNHTEFFEHPFVDIKHAPSAESLDKANFTRAFSDPETAFSAGRSAVLQLVVLRLSHLEKARMLEKKNDLEAAYEYYTHGLAHLVSAVEYETSASQRELLKQLASQYFTQAEAVKTRLKLEGSRTSNSVPPRPPPPWARGQNRQSCQTETSIHPKKVPTVAGTERRINSPTLHARDQMVPPAAPPTPQISSQMDSELAESTPSSPSGGLLTYLKSLFIASHGCGSEQSAGLAAETETPGKQQASTHPSSSEVPSQPPSFTQYPKTDPVGQSIMASCEVAQTSEQELSHARNSTSLGKKLTLSTKEAHMKNRPPKQRFPVSSATLDPSPNYPLNKASHFDEGRQACSLSSFCPPATTSSPSVSASSSGTNSSVCHEEAVLVEVEQVVSPYHSCSTAMPSGDIGIDTVVVATGGLICKPNESRPRRNLWVRAFHLLSNRLKFKLKHRRVVDYPAQSNSDQLVGFSSSSPTLRLSSGIAAPYESASDAPNAQMERSKSRWSGHIAQSETLVRPIITESPSPTRDMASVDPEEKPLRSQEGPSIHRMQRVRALSMDLNSSPSIPPGDLDSNVTSTSTYAQQMALLADTARLFELSLETPAFRASQIPITFATNIILTCASVGHFPYNRFRLLPAIPHGHRIVLAYVNDQRMMFVLVNARKSFSLKGNVTAGMELNLKHNNNNNTFIKSIECPGLPASSSTTVPNGSVM
ncbi:serine/threonine-protein kinase ULK3, partial [Clonorchis sinensis]